MDFTIQDFKALDHGQRQQIALQAICLALSVLLLTWFFRKRPGPAQKHRLPPGPKGWPILGAMPLLTGLRHVALQKLSKKYGPLMYIRIGSIPAVVVSNARVAKEVYKTHDRIMASRPQSTVIKYLSYDYHDITSAPYGNHWREARKICTLELLTASRINRFQDKRRREINKMVQCILEEAKGGNTIRADDVFGAMTMNVVTQMMWNKSHHTYMSTASADEVEDVSVHLFQEFMALVGTANIGDLIPGTSWLSMSLQGIRKRMTLVHKKLDDFLEEILEEHKQQRTLATVAGKVSSDADDFVDVLLDHREKSQGDQCLSEDAIKAILMNMVVAGTDSTSHTLEWALAELVRKPEMMKRAQDEVSSVVGPNRLVTEDDLPKLDYLNAVLRETLRLHAVAAAGVPHASITDCEIDGYHIPGGSWVLINLWAIQRDPEVWERPMEFHPERFLDQEACAGVDWKGQDFHLIPFGAGRRMCPGMSLASSILHLALAQVLHCVDWSLPGGQKPEDLDMTEDSGILAMKSVPLALAAKPRLSDAIISEGL